MERTLSLVLDDECKISLTLMQDEADIIDEFTSKKFENSNQIRERFKKQITAFLEQNRNYIEAIIKKTGKNFSGRIVVLEVRKKDDSIEYIEKRVLYKKHLVAFKELVKDRGTMLKFLQLEKIGYNEYGFRKLISPFLCREIKYTKYNVPSQTDFLKRSLKKNNFYDILRIIIKAYEIERKTRKLKTIEAIYEIYKNQKNKSNSQSSQKKLPLNISKVNDTLSETDNFFTIDGISYHEDEIPFDLDELNRMAARCVAIDRKPDGLDTNERTK